MLMDEKWNNYKVQSFADGGTMAHPSYKRKNMEIKEKEVLDAIMSYDGDKTPSPDGFNMNFMKRKWSLFKLKMMEFFQKFFNTRKLTKRINSSFITLVAKKHFAKSLNDFRLISLIESIYKILTKTLANRLKQVVGSLISQTQSAFVEGRQIIDSILIANEVIDNLKKSVNRGLVLKLDFEKAFDKVN
ncbi:uncharacterized protein LOC111309507 [Durio zibethinus]|uniref:Uncharacterized protein LOC111309507 n=1 Tax=Durio zibethinus TaxID=66656 RepID=A0A6P6AHD3_DURZI|nr:uncharacterized protein LOC111309507 [Durio zibethinus]